MIKDADRKTWKYFARQKIMKKCIAVPVVFLLFVSLSIVCPAKGVAARKNTTSMETDMIRIVWSRGAKYFTDWKVRGPGDEAAAEKNWHSLVTVGLDDQAMSRHLALSGKSGKDWIGYRKEDSCAVAENSYLDGQLLVQRRLCKSKDPYRLHLEISIQNISDRMLTDSALAVLLGPGLGEYPAEGLGIAEGLYSYVKPAVFIDGKVLSVNIDAAGEEKRIDLKDRNWQWAGLQSRYFAMLLAPLDAPACRAIEYRLTESFQTSQLPPRYLPETTIYLDTAGLKPKETIENRFIVFSGPKNAAALGGGANDFRELLFSGQWQWMRMLCFALLWVLAAIHAVIPNWGVSILVLALLVRVMIYPLAGKMMAGQQAFASVQQLIGPRIKEIKKQYSGEEQSEKILALYKKHGVSPFTGMKPLVIVMIQLPVFVALFHVLGQAVELQDASFLWIDTLGLPDRLFSFGKNLPFFGAYFNLLPFLMAFSTLLTIRLLPSPGQNTLFLVLMAAGFLLLFYPFPSGMVLYWTAANVLQIFQQMLMKKTTIAPRQ